MLTWVLWLALGMVLIAMLLAVWRLLRGPAPADRVLSLDTLYVNAIALIVLLGMVWDDQSYFEVAVLIALLGFIGTVALAYYLARRKVME
ncbi:multicomponent K+:H+ antiporter subunit F [Chitinivorax tropicus]|uniref:Multicomponent K+:H+ antiporter subunit F n=1 Tax=Chitinivorax tropicus TaxID=714531 RepID=A0A840MQE9_9PROT|nr:K+/H+ antiporter subunit F [Chitinivorax tropicus]MBB5019665.1 multicomponent K+:H+ antiporter subunit F [Chitinivorax tropicus]